MRASFVKYRPQVFDLYAIMQCLEMFETLSEGHAIALENWLTMRTGRQHEAANKKDRMAQGLSHSKVSHQGELS